MRVHLTIDEETLNEACQLSGYETPQKVLSQALSEYVERLRARTAISDSEEHPFVMTRSGRFWVIAPAFDAASVDTVAISRLLDNEGAL